MKKGDVISYQRLCSLGWVPALYFGYCLLFVNADKRLIWDSETSTVVIIYTDERYATW